MKRLLWWIVLFGTAAPTVHAQLTQSELKAVRDTLYVGNLSEKDLNFGRRPIADSNSLALVHECVDRPLDAADDLMKLHEQASTTPAAILSKLSRQVFGDQAPPPRTMSGSVQPTGNLPLPLVRPISILIEALSDCDATIHAATQSLSESQKREVIESLPRWAANDSRVRFSFAKSPEIDQGSLLGLLAKVNLPAIRGAAAQLAAIVEQEIPALKQAASVTEWKGSVRFQTDGVVVEVSGVGDDAHASLDSDLSIDLGGHNRYVGRFGAGIGYASVLIDLGESEFEVPDAGLGTGILGVGLAYCLGGNDTFRAGSASLGCGIAGVGVLYRQGGNDDYRSLALTQGFGCFGIGLLVDTGGTDTFVSRFLAQGAACTQGVGWLATLAGDDLFSCGGWLPVQGNGSGASYLSDGQGFGRGRTSYTGRVGGGIGLLTAKDGTSTFISDLGGQGCGEAGGLGSLYASGQNHNFLAAGRAQGYGASQGAGYLIDLGNKETWTLSKARGQGSGESRGVGFALCESKVAMISSAAGHPAAGVRGGLGLFLAEGGPDRFNIDPDQAGTGSIAGGLGVFCDLTGGSVYDAETSWGDAVAKGDFFVGFASKPDAVPPSEFSSTSNAAASTDMSTANLASLFNVAAGFSPGFRKSAFQALRNLGAPGLTWAIQNCLSSGLEKSAAIVADLADRVGDSGRNAVAKACASPSDSVASGACLAAALGKISVDSKTVLQDLDRPAVCRNAARLAGAIRCSQAESKLLGLAASADPYVRLAVARSLANIGGSDAIPTAEALLQSQRPIRRAAMRILLKSPDQIVAIAKELIAQGKEQLARTAIGLLGRAGTPEALNIVQQELDGPTPGMKISAMLALNGRFPTSALPKLRGLLNDGDPRVRAVARGIDVGPLRPR